MPINGLVTWEAGGITDALANDFNETEVHRSTTGIDGVYSEITGIGTRITLVAGTEDYSYTDVTAELTYYYKVRHRSATGKNSGFSLPFTFITSAMTVITDLKVYAAYLHPSDYRGTLQAFPRTAVQLTEAGLSPGGNRAYHKERDYALQLFLTYTAAGVVKGINLTGATIEFTVFDSTQTPIFTKSTTGGTISILSQAVEFNPDGTGNRGGLQANWADDETGADAYPVGTWDCELVVTWSGSEETDSFVGQFQIVK